MGFKPWRTLSVLLIASAALVGCNNTAQKDKSAVAAPKVDPALAKGQPSKLPDPTWPGSSNGTKFPTQPASVNASPFDQKPLPANNVQPVSVLGGNGQLNNSSPWPPPSNPGNNSTPSLPPQNSFGPPPVPTPSSNFGTSRLTTSDGLPNGSTPIGPPPAGFSGGR
jgi:hypothetical protein